MKIYRATQEESQLDADAAFGYLIENDDGFAWSVAAGQTIAWDVPKEDEGGWYIHIQQRLYGLFNIEPSVEE